MSGQDVWTWIDCLISLYQKSGLSIDKFMKCYTKAIKTTPIQRHLMFDKIEPFLIGQNPQYIHTLDSSVENIRNLLTIGTLSDSRRGILFFKEDLNTITYDINYILNITALASKFSHQDTLKITAKIYGVASKKLVQEFPPIEWVRSHLKLIDQDLHLKISVQSYVDWSMWINQSTRQQMGYRTPWQKKCANEMFRQIQQACYDAPPSIREMVLIRNQTTLDPYGSLKVGDEIMAVGLISLSIIFLSFYLGKDCCIYRYTLPIGTPCLFINRNSTWEVVLPHGTMSKVTAISDIDVVGTKVKMYSVRVIG
jgi:hypothetical protein